MKKTTIIILITFISFSSFSQTFNSQRLDSLFQILAKKDKFMGSISVSQNGKLIYNNTIGYRDIENLEKATLDTKYRIGSISKMFTASLILKAIEEKKISLEENIYKYFPKVENAKKITIKSLLNHRSGIHDFTNDEAYFDYNSKPKSKSEMVEIITKGGSDFEPNIQAEYSNSNYVLLSYILEEIYKKNYAEILDTKIIKPLNLKNTYFGSKTDINNNESFSYKFNNKWQKEVETDLSIPIGAGAIISNTADLTIFIESLFSGKIITHKSLNQMKTMTEQFGLGIFEFKYEDKISYGHTGGIDGFKTALEYFPEEKIAIALLSNGAVYTNHDILSCAKSACFGKPFEIPLFENIKVDSKILNTYLGTYSSTAIPIKISISQNDGQLFAQATGQATLALEASSPTVFKMEKAGIVLEFNSNKKEMKLKQGGREFMFTIEK